MDQLKLKYIISLVSDIGAKSMDDARKLTAAQDKIAAALKKTSGEVGLVERMLLRMGNVGSASAERQANYLGRLAMKYHDVSRAAEAATTKVGKFAQATANTAAGVTAGAYAVGSMTKAPMEYSKRLAYMANTAFSDRDDAGWAQGKASLDAAVRAAVRTGGGKKDDAAGALDFVIASGALSASDSIKALPIFTKAASASGATPEEMAAIGVRAAQNFKIPVNQMDETLSMGMAGGKAGGFELKNMAKWLPEQMAMAGNLGMSGKEGFAKLVAWNQASVLTAGSKDAAGNNMRDLLMELNSPHFKGFLAKEYLNNGENLKKGERHQKMQSIDEIFLDYQKRGVGKVDATMEIMDKVLAKDKTYMDLKAKLATAGGTEEKKAITESMVAQIQGSAVGKVFHNQQSLMAYLALSNNRDYIAKTLDSIQSGKGAIDTDYRRISGESDFKKEQAQTEASFASDTAFAKVAPIFNDIYDKSTELARSFPLTTAGAVGAAGALTALSAAAAGSGLMRLLGIGAAGGTLASAAGKVAGTLGVGATVAGSTAAATGAARMGLGAMLKKAVGPIGMLATELFYTSDEDVARLERGDRDRKLMAQGSRGKGYNDERLMRMSGATGAASGSDAGSMASMGTAKVDGKIDVNVRLTDDRTAVSATVTQQPTNVKINSGATNPAGYAMTGGRR